MKISLKLCHQIAYILGEPFKMKSKAGKINEMLNQNPHFLNVYF